MSKIGSHRPFGHLKHKLWVKERPIVKLPVWLSSTKSRESTRFPHVQVTYYWKALNEGYNFALNLITIGSLHAKLCAPKVTGVLVARISKFPLGSPRTKNPFKCGPLWRGVKYYKREGGGFPQVRVVVSPVSLSCPWFILAPKVLQPCTKHLVLVLCRFMWVIEACQFFLVPSQNSSTPLYPSKVLRAREHVPTLHFFVFFSLDSYLSSSRNWEHVIKLFKSLMGYIKANLNMCIAFKVGSTPQVI
jgi:hypothetical protein